MKKVILIAMMLCTVLCMSGCSDTVPVSTEQVSTGGATSKKYSGSFAYLITEEGNAVIEEYSGTEQRVSIPASIDGYTVTAISSQAFKSSTITQIALPDTIHSINDNPFSNCENLALVSVSPDHPTLATIDGVLFSKEDKTLVCYPRRHQPIYYSIPEGILSIGNNAFKNASTVASIDIPSSVAKIGDYAFYGCSNVEDIDIPSQVTYIGKYAFAEMDELEKVYNFYAIEINTLPEGLFSGCGSLRSVNIPSTVTSIGDFAFQTCISLWDVDLPSGLKTIGSDAFCGANLGTLDLPQSLETIGTFAFLLNNRLDEVTIPEGTEKIWDAAFMDCKNLRDVSLPASLTHIGDSAFKNCSNGLVFTVPRNSYAAQYCKENGFSYVYPDVSDWLN